ncbi:hypothetical protein [Streptomyces chartreusis]
MVIGQPKPAPVLQHGRQAKAFDGGCRQHDQRVSILARTVQTPSPQLRLAQYPVNQGRKVGERAFQDQAVQAVGGVNAVYDGEWTVREARIPTSRSGGLRGYSLRDG